MDRKIILCVDLQNGFLLEVIGGRAEGRNARPSEGDHCAWDAPNAFIQRAAEAGIQTWYVAWSPDLNFADTFSVVGDPDWKAVEERFQNSDSGWGGFHRLHMTNGSPVFFKRHTSVFENQQFLDELARQDVKEITVIGCDAYECCPANALEGRAHGLTVNIVQDHVFGGEMDRLPLPTEDKGTMRKAINAFRASDERKKQIECHLYNKRRDLGLPPAAAEGVNIITEEAFFSKVPALAARRPLTYKQEQCGTLSSKVKSCGASTFDP